MALRFLDKLGLIPVDSGTAGLLEAWIREYNGEAHCAEEARHRKSAH